MGWRLPARSSSSPARVCGPSEKAWVYVIVLPETLGAGAETPSIVAPTTPVTSSLATTWSAPAEAIVEPSAGVEEVRLGFVLSTRRLVTAVEVVELPALSVTVTRRS